jgi:hypothetical protein
VQVGDLAPAAARWESLSEQRQRQREKTRYRTGTYYHHYPTTYYRYHLLPLATTAAVDAAGEFAAHRRGRSNGGPTNGSPWVRKSRLPQTNAQADPTPPWDTCTGLFPASIAAPYHSGLIALSRSSTAALTGSQARCCGRGGASCGCQIR